MFHQLQCKDTDGKESWKEVSELAAGFSGAFGEHTPACHIYRSRFKLAQSSCLGHKKAKSKKSAPMHIDVTSDPIPYPTLSRPEKLDALPNNLRKLKTSELLEDLGYHRLYFQQ